jgi:hypothetical protein
MRAEDRARQPWVLAAEQQLDDRLRTVNANLSELAERRQRVEQALTSAAGVSSLCSISRSAGPVPGVKYLEGQMAALMELESAVRRGDDLVSTSAEIRNRWSSRLDSARQRGMSAAESRVRRGCGRTHRCRWDVTAKFSVRREPHPARSRTRGSAVPALHGATSRQANDPWGRSVAVQNPHSALSYPPSFAQAGSRLLGCRRRDCARSSSTSDSAQSSTITGCSETST